MLFSSAEDLEDKIIKLTLREPASIKSIHTRLNSEKPLSLRAVYKAIDKLMEAQVLIKLGKRVIVDQEWLRRVGEKLHSAPIPMPSAGERVVYTFASMDRVDAFWKTIVLPTEESFSLKEIFFYNPHNFWPYIPERKESEEEYYRHFETVNQHAFLTVGGDSEADKEGKRAYQTEYMQIDTRNIAALPRTDHFTVAGPFIINGRLQKRTATCIDELYASNRSIKDILPELLEICRNPGSIKFIIENNPLKAKKLRKLLARNFYFPQQR
jgi:hypothetical protein